MTWVCAVWRGGEGERGRRSRILHASGPCHGSRAKPALSKPGDPVMLFFPRFRPYLHKGEGGGSDAQVFCTMHAPPPPLYVQRVRRSLLVTPSSFQCPVPRQPPPPPGTTSQGKGRVGREVRIRERL